MSADHDHALTEILDSARAGAPSLDPAGSSAALPALLDDGRYLVGPLLGRGGSGEVFRAFDRRLGRAVALKVFPPGSADAEDVRRWREVRTLAALEHPRLVRIFDVGEHDTRPFFVMQLVEGRSLAGLLSEGSLDVGETLRLGAGVAAGLGHVHRHGVVHRDVKPGNVLLDHAGRAYLTDFGIATRLGAAAITGDGLVLGTAAYLAPEQVRGRHVGAPADVYALGLVLLEALTGRRQYPGDPIESAVARLHRAPDRPGWLPVSVDAVLAAMTSEDPTERPSATEIAGHLARLLPPGDADDAEEIAVAPPVTGVRWGATQVSTGTGLVAVGTGARVLATGPRSLEGVPVASRRVRPRRVHGWVAVAAGFALVVGVAATAFAGGSGTGTSATLAETPPGVSGTLAPEAGSAAGLVLTGPPAPSVAAATQDLPPAVEASRAPAAESPASTSSAEPSRSSSSQSSAPQSSAPQSSAPQSSTTEDVPPDTGSSDPTRTPAEETSPTGRPSDQPRPSTTDRPRADAPRSTPSPSPSSSSAAKDEDPGSTASKSSTATKDPAGGSSADQRSSDPSRTGSKGPGGDSSRASGGDSSSASGGDSSRASGGDSSRGDDSSGSDGSSRSRSSA